MLSFLVSCTSFLDFLFGKILLNPYENTIPPPYVWLAPAELPRTSPTLEGLEYTLPIRLPLLSLDISYSMIPSPER